MHTLRGSEVTPHGRLLIKPSDVTVSTSLFIAASPQCTPSVLLIK